MRTVLMLLEGVDNIPQKFYCSPQLKLCLHQSEIMFTSALSQPPARVSTFFTPSHSRPQPEILNNSTKFEQYLSQLYHTLTKLCCLLTLSTDLGLH